MQVRTSMLLTILMVAATLGPLLISEVSAEGENNSPNEQFIGNIEDFDVEIHGKPYITIEGETVYSATRLHKMAWPVLL